MLCSIWYIVKHVPLHGVSHNLLVGLEPLRGLHPLARFCWSQALCLSENASFRSCCGSWLGRHTALGWWRSFSSEEASIGFWFPCFVVESLWVWSLGLCEWSVFSLSLVFYDFVAACLGVDFFSFILFRVYCRLTNFICSWNSPALSLWIFLLLFESVWKSE